MFLVYETKFTVGKWKVISSLQRRGEVVVGGNSTLWRGKSPKRCLDKTAPSAEEYKINVLILKLRDLTSSQFDSIGLTTTGAVRLGCKGNYTIISQ